MTPCKVYVHLLSKALAHLALLSFCQTFGCMGFGHIFQLTTAWNFIVFLITWNYSVQIVLFHICSVASRGRNLLAQGLSLENNKNLLQWGVTKKKLFSITSPKSLSQKISYFDLQTKILPVWTYEQNVHSKQVKKKIFLRTLYTYSVRTDVVIFLCYAWELDFAPWKYQLAGVRSY